MYNIRVRRRTDGRLYIAHIRKQGDPCEASKYLIQLHTHRELRNINGYILSLLTPLVCPKIFLGLHTTTQFH